MRKTKIIIALTSVIIGSICFKSFYDYNINHSRIDYEVYVDGASSSTIPSKGNYEVLAACNNGKASWNYGTWKLSITETTSSSNKCYLEFYTITDKKYINQYVIDNVNTTQGDGKIINENGYRYQGSNPNNYVLFNNELWRIIGTFDTKTTSSDSQNLTKIIRNDTLGAYTYEDYGTVNTWMQGQSTIADGNPFIGDLNNFLNGDYYNSARSNCSSFYAQNICDQRKTGIKDNYRDMIEYANWYLGTNASAAYTVSNFYNYERTLTAPNNDLTAYGRVALMYPSDYGYAVLAEDCPRSILLNAYGTYSNVSLCSRNNWLFKYGNEFLLTPSAYTSDQFTYTNVFSITEYGGVSESYLYAYESNTIRPTLYLKSDTFILGGTGSLDDPYVLGI